MAKKKRSKGAREANQKVGGDTPTVVSAEQPVVQKATPDGESVVDRNRVYEEVRPKG